MTNWRKQYWIWGLLIIISILLSFFRYSADTPVVPDDLPWQIGHPTADTSRIFALTLGASTVAEAERRFREVAKPGLFRMSDGRLAAEAYFEQVNLAGLKAKIVVSISIPEEELQAIYDRGLGMRAGISGKRIVLRPEDQARLRALPISGLTYLPAVSLDEATFVRRFGRPGQRLPERKGDTVHLLYPWHGLDITLGGGKPVLQYVPPRDFDRLVQPLLADARASSDRGQPGR